MDITRCSGDCCPVKNKCKRAQSIEIPSYCDSWFMKPPFNIIHGKFDCDMFWGDQADMLLEQLKSIMKKKVVKKNKK